MDDKCKIIFGMEGLEDFQKAVYYAVASLKSVVRIVAAYYALSSKERHYAKYAKRKRIRKKYRDRAWKRALQKARED